MLPPTKGYHLFFYTLFRYDRMEYITQLLCFIMRKIVPFLSMIAVTSLVLSGCETLQLMKVEQPVPESTQQASRSTKATIEILAPTQQTEMNEPGTMESSTTLPSDSAIYEKYSADLFASLVGKKPVVLFFHAQWCPECRALEKAITADLANFPMGSHILQINYDTETDLKDEYDVKVQTTLIVLDAEGARVETFLNPSLDKLKAAIEESL